MNQRLAGQALLQVHRELRARLDAIMASLEGGLTESDRFATSCLAFCRALRRRHIGESNDAFGVVRRHAPELDEVIDALVQDHEFLDPMLDRVEAMTVDLHRASTTALQRELDGVAAVLFNHLVYEERVLVQVLDRLSCDLDVDDDRALRVPLEGIFDDGEQRAQVAVSLLLGPLVSPATREISTSGPVSRPRKRRHREV